MELVFTLLQQHKLFAKPSKCSFALKQLEYLGHIISKTRVATDPAKTLVMQNWPVPSSVADLRGFLGLTGYYRKFVKYYGLLAKPLIELLKKNLPFQWTSVTQQAFETLKQAMITTPVLSLPNFSKPFVIETDTCDTGIGDVFSQEGHPIAYYSKALGTANQKLSIYEKEFMAIMMAVDRWRPYLLRGPFVIKTDHKFLCHLDTHVLDSEMQKKAMTKLIGLQYHFQYKKGVDNKSADALSRVGQFFACSSVSLVQPPWIKEIVNSYAVDMQAQKLLQELAVISPNDQGYELVGGLIKHKGRVWIGENSALQTKIIAAFHCSAIGGHSGVQATFQRIHKLFVWSNLRNSVQEFVQ